jgi:hypothetical protein
MAKLRPLHDSVFNAGAAQLPDGDTLLLVRVEDRRGISHLTAARSRDGIANCGLIQNRRCCPIRSIIRRSFSTRSWSSPGSIAAWPAATRLTIMEHGFPTIARW